MDTTLQSKATVKSNTCQENIPAFSFQIFNPVYKLLTKHFSILFKTQVVSPKQVLQQNPSAGNDFIPVYLKTKEILPLKEIRAEVKDRFVRLYIPSKNSRGEIIDNTEIIKQAKNLFIRMFGGCTLYSGATGAWLNEGGILIEEDILIIESYASQFGFDSRLYAVQLIALDIKKRFQQASVTLIINDKMHLL